MDLQQYRIRIGTLIPMSFSSKRNVGRRSKNGMFFSPKQYKSICCFLNVKYVVSLLVLQHLMSNMWPSIHTPGAEEYLPVLHCDSQDFHLFYGFQCFLINDLKNAEHIPVSIWSKNFNFWARYMNGNGGQKTSGGLKTAI